MDPTTPTTNAQRPGHQEEGEESLPALFAKTAALSAAIDGQAAQLVAELGRQYAGLPGLAPAAPPASPAAPPAFDAGALVAQAQEQLVVSIARLRGLAEGLGVAPAAAAAGAPPDPLGALLAGLADHAQAQLGGHAGTTAGPTTTSSTDPDLTEILTSAQAAHGKAQRAANELLAGMGLDPADPLAGLALRLPSTAAAPPTVPAAGQPGGDLMGAMQADAKRLQAMLGDMMAKILPPP